MVGKDITKAIKFLEENDVIGFPTETVYGLAGNALSNQAVTKIFNVKERPSFDPLIIHIGDKSQIERYVENIPESLWRFIDQWMPGPLTVLLDKKDVIPDLVTAGSERVAVRIPAHPLAQELLSQIDFPLAAPSANPFGYISPTTAQHVSNQLGDKIPYILDGGPCTVGLESTIIGEENGNIIVYRKGGLSIQEILKMDDTAEIRTHSTSNPAAPGMLKSHYAPNVPLIIVEDYSTSIGQVGYITFGEKVQLNSGSIQYELSRSKDYAEAAQNLFKMMRDLDRTDLTRIEVKLLPEIDLGIAINDRLRRAAVRS